MTILILAEHDNNELKSSTLNTIGAAQKIGGAIHILVIGAHADNVAKKVSTVSSIEKVLHVDAPHFEHPMAEDVAPILVQLGKNYTHILAPATTFGKNILPRVAALLDVQAISEIIEIIDNKTFKRPVYAGNAIATIESSDAIKVMTVRTTAFDAVSFQDNSVSIDKIEVSPASGLSSFKSQEFSKSERPELTAARIVVSGGRGVGSADNFKIIEKLADKLGAAVGASRAAVDSGFVPNDYQVGQTGKIVAPDLYIAIGISGAIQHLAGMKDSKIIVAINKDPDAPIFSVADYGLVADLFTAVPELESKL